ncbi:PhzF family phenazine biosynthesis protein [Amphritea sp. 2_MG-2023]|uniref:PhzF family phenazine biosynthesis protein n=1 Tax=Amphritea TaxID=515417 RepID=UPI001C068F0C|nr:MULTISPECIES: PhzF family phenazine biosynthesis protein [Amphritea]MBU2967312.1 PhzF family phenazine biosynthesis protein [Amphritea atlantica]MDO6420460.1 PhzF family phenazine biosynthesis protein [Amphritea sp. 2_MG-2023]
MVNVGKNLNVDIVDVFTDKVGEGNPVAIIHDADNIEDARMQKIASWIGLPETVFLVTPKGANADYAVRIFAPSCELNFAGHPSIGALASLRNRYEDWRDRKDFIQECNAGEVQMLVEHHENKAIILFETPVVAEVTPLASETEVKFRQAISVHKKASSCDLVHAGANWIIMLFEDECDVSSAIPNQEKILELSHEHDVSGVTIIAPISYEPSQYQVRSFAPIIGVPEDAACGGGNACAAASVAVANGNIPVHYVARQGQKLKRNAFLFASSSDKPGRFKIGGEAKIAVSGSFHF